MKCFILLVSTLSMAAMLPTTFASTGIVPDDCVPEGGSVTQTFDRPALNSGGMPTNANYVGGTGQPQAYDVDTWSGPDAMGPGVPSSDGNSASIDIQNSGGSLFGPNGADVEGGLEGECVEVVMTWKIKFKATVTRCFTTSVGVRAGVQAGAGTEHCVEIEIWIDAVVTDGPDEVCPC